MDAVSDHHPHEPAIPPTLDDEGRCLVCVVLVRVSELEGLLRDVTSWLSDDTPLVLQERIKAAVEVARAGTRDKGDGGTSPHGASALDGNLPACECGGRPTCNLPPGVGTRNVQLAHPTKRGYTEAAVDLCIAELAQALNAAGLQTVASCCGHGRNAGSIVLEDGRELVIFNDRDRAEAAIRQSLPAPETEGETDG